MGRKSPILTYLTCTWRPRWGWPQSNFCKIFGSEKVQSIGFVFFTIAVLIELRLVTERGIRNIFCFMSYLVFITRRRSYSFAEYWKHFMAFERCSRVRLYSAGSEPIWMKFGALWVHCLPLALADCGRDGGEARARERAETLFFVR